MPDTVNYYMKLYEKYGRDEKSLGWTKNKQNIRFKQLFRFFELANSSVLDVGCGFGDMLMYIKESMPDKSIEYCGIDVVEKFVEEAKSTFINEKELFICTDVFEYLQKNEKQYDYIVASGIFGINGFDNDVEQYEHIRKTLKLTYDKCNVGISMNFLSNKVDYRTSKTDFHADPAEILNMAYELSRNVILDNGVMPFEFCITIFKDDGFSVEKTVFNNYKG